MNMKKARLEEQVENVLRLIKKGRYDAEQLRTLYRNIESNENITDSQSETLIEAIETRLWNDYPKEAKKILGPRNSDTRRKMVTYFEDIEGRFDLTANHHKNKVKLGGNVISGQALIYDYISYRNDNTRIIAHIAFRKIDQNQPLEIVVIKYPVGESATENASFRIFTPEEFGKSTELFESYLTSVLAGKVE